MTILKRFSGIAIALWAAIPLVHASAQDPRRLAMPDSIPVDLASALIAAGGIPGEPIILVGSLPEWFASRIAVPSSARVLGAASSGNIVVGIYTVKTTPDTAVTQLRTALLARGWRLPPPTPNYGGGFRPATMTTAQQMGPATRATLCRDDQTLIVSGATTRGGSANVTMRLTSALGPTSYSTCNPPPRPEMPANRLLFPTLYDPPITGEATTPNACFPNYTNATGTNNYLRTTLSPELVLEHYTRQLQDSGWTATTSLAPPVGRTFARRDSTGAPIEVTLTVAGSPMGASCRDVTMQVRGPTKR